MATRLVYRSGKITCYVTLPVTAGRSRGRSGGSPVFVVLGASGNTGRAVAETLLSQNKKVRVVVRDGDRCLGRRPSSLARRNRNPNGPLGAPREMTSLQ